MINNTKFLIILLVIFFNTHCSFDNKTGIWKNKEKERIAALKREQDESKETITILQVRSGTYSYRVHDYENKGNPSYTKLAESGATVTVYYNNSSTKYTVPSGVGNVWKVFTFTESGGLTKVGTMDNASDEDEVF